MRVAMLPAFLEAADFTEFIQEATFTFAMAKPTLKPQWQGLYYPLTHAVWACVLLFMVTMPFFMIVASVWVCSSIRHAKHLTNKLKLKLSNLKLPPSQLAENDYSDKSRGKYWEDRKSSLAFSAFGMFFSQSLCDLPTTLSSRVLVLSWLIFAFIIGTAYRGNLTAFLTIPKYPPRIDTLEQLADSTARAKFRPNSSSFYQYFQESELSAYRRVYQRADLISTVTVGLREVMNNNAAYFQERMNMDLEIARHYPSWKERSKLYIAKENVMPGFAAWMVPKDGPYIENLNKVIRAAREVNIRGISSGLLQKWTEDVMRYEKRQIFLEQLNDLTEMSEETDDASAGGGDGNLALTVVHMQGPLILLVLGLAMATVSFLAEVVVHHCSRRFLARRRR
ncbi:ionotropic receptor 93a-like [Macrobrachium rosenbergii]|uniref:ionotropic receptor 93a-like n=1 Tax=Macrobrachium rosenbergii TaxID=79674 RepID=UPI0034D4C819